MNKTQRQSQTRTFRQVFGYLKKYRILAVLSLALAAVSVGLTLYVPILTGNAVDLLLGKGRVDMPGLCRILVKIGGAVAVTALAQWVMNVCNHYVTFHVARDIREDAFHRLQELPLSYLDARPSGDILSRIVADVDTFADGLLMGFTQFFTGVLTIVGTLFFMFGVSAPIALAVVCITPVSFFAARFIAGRSYFLFRQQSQSRGEQTAFIEEVIGNQKLVKTFCREEAVGEQFAQGNERLAKCSLRAIFFSSLTNPLTRFVNSLVYAGVGILGAFAAVGGGISIGRLSCFLSYANQYTKPFNEISGVVTELQNALACAARIFELIRQPPQTPDEPNARRLRQAKGEVSLKDVSFGYTPDRKLIQNLCLEVKPGRRVAIVGPTGCGKTTLINLLMRFYETDSGVIRVDGTDIRRITRSSLRTSYGMVLQETWLRAGTIRDNIRMGKPEALDEEVERAARAAHAHSFIRRLPKGYDTVIGEEGGGLSQGQRQLLCIARVMLILPPMLILDEATSSIDTRTEAKIQSAFAEMMRGRTSFIVAHRLSTIREADVILAMRQGDIVEQGDHETLLKKGGFYAELYNSQFAGRQEG